MYILCSKIIFLCARSYRKIAISIIFMELDEEVGDIRGAIFLLYTCLHYVNATKQA